MNWFRIALAAILCLFPIRALASPPALASEAAILIEAASGRVLYEKNADRLMYPASMTKIMTCLLALENANLQDTITISPAAAGTEYAYLEAGQRLTMEELLTEMMMESDNGASVAVAEHLAPSVGAFAQRMTDRAASLGAGKTRFANPNGLPDAQHVSTARDMMKISRFAWSLPAFRRIVGTSRHTVQFLGSSGKPWEAKNTNRLLDSYLGMVGIKTGWTDAAGGCLAGAAERNGITLISIVMNAPDAQTRFADTAALMDYGFPMVRLVKGPVKEQLQRTVWVHDGTTFEVTAHPRADIRFTLFEGESERRCSYHFDMPRFIHAPVKQGDKLGDLVLTYDGREVGRIDMIADTSLGKGFSPIALLLGFYDSILGPLLG
ncbi:MAG: D-alanyl-D-alanine carboxypeptidase [Schwartzia sp.]|nr:D-alanyl-D-alanine carboxypeptidase [Schwartzia sp. (in: firmicutes)]